MTEKRRPISRTTRVVVKVGSSAFSTPGAVARLAADVASVRASGKSVVVVSSGAIALGWPKLGYKSRPKPKDVAKLQASAAAGQSLLMRAYEEAFTQCTQSGIPVAQVLLTHADLADRARANNARAALAELLSAGAVPVLNENDSVAVEEINFGDNDQLAALVVPLVDADLLVLLSDVEGVLDTDGRRVAEVADASDVKRFVKASTSASGTGGMASKIEAARRATLAGAHVVIADARRERVLEEVTAGADVGTWFAAAGNRMNARRYWIAFTLRPRGDVVLDAGAAEAVRHGNKSVLCVGVLGVRGDFREGDAVRLVAPSGEEIGRGLVRLDAVDAARAAGRPRAASRKDEGDGVLVHRDDLVVS